MTADDIQAAVDMLQDKLKKLKAERPVIICPEGHKELYERYFPEANVIVNPAVPGDGVYIVDNELRRMINKQSEGKE